MTDDLDPAVQAALDHDDTLDLTDLDRLSHRTLGREHGTPVGDDLAGQIRAAISASGTVQEPVAGTMFGALLPELRAQLLRAALLPAGYDPPPVPGTWWLDTKATYLPDGSRSVVRVVSVSKTVTGWQASIVRYTVRMQDENAAGPTRGVIYLDTLVADYLPLPANEVPS